MTPPTQTEALEEGIKLWTWLADTGERNKREWPGWHNYEEKYGYTLFACPCCHTARSRSELKLSGCTGCPLLSSWGPDPGPFVCENVGSPYNLWSRATSRGQRKEWAGEIAGLHMQALQPDYHRCRNV